MNIEKWDIKNREVTLLILNNENYYKKHLIDGTHSAFFVINDETNEIIGFVDMLNYMKFEGV